MVPDLVTLMTLPQEIPLGILTMGKSGTIVLGGGKGRESVG